MICGSGRWKGRLVKAAGAEPYGQIRDEKLPAVVARSTFGSQNAQNTLFYTIVRPRLEVESRKSARHCGAKHIAKSKVLKTDGLGAFLEVQMLKKCTPLWREAHCQVKSVKN